MSSAGRPRITHKEKTMLNLLHVYTSPNHGSSVLRYWPVTHSHLSTHLTHDPWLADPQTHCPLCCAVDRKRNRHSKVLNVRIFIFTLTVLETPSFGQCYLKCDISVTLRLIFTKLYRIVNNRCLFVYVDILLNSFEIYSSYCIMFTSSLFSGHTVCHCAYIGSLFKEIQKAVCQGSALLATTPGIALALLRLWDNAKCICSIIRLSIS